MKYRLKIVCILIAALAGGAGPATAERDASPVEMRVVNAALGDFKRAGVFIARPRVVIVKDHEANDFGLYTDWYAAAWHGTIYLRDTEEYRLDAQAHFAQIGSILGDTSRTRRIRRIANSLTLQYAASTAFHELVHVARFATVGDLVMENFEEGLADAVAADRVVRWCLRATGYRYCDSSISYPKYTSSVRRLSVTRTGTKSYLAPAAVYWRIHQVTNGGAP